MGRPIIEIATTPAECAHFVACDRADFTTLVIELRTAIGEPRDQIDIDNDALQLSEATLESGHAAFLHLLDTSKTGLCGVSRGAARALDRAAPGRTLALVDASEGRTYASEVRRDLGQGMMVLVSGSQFVGGPPFSAALLLPPVIVAFLEALGPDKTIDLPIARFDAPRPMRRLMSNAAPMANPGLGLRWAAALHVYEDYLRIDETLRRDILETFSSKARAIAARHGFLNVEALLLDHADDPLRESIVTLLPLTPCGPRQAMQYSHALREALARPCPGLAGDAVCHIGHPIPVGARSALPLSASAPMVRDVVRRMDMGLNFDRAMTPVLRDLATLFRKWEALAG